MENRALEAFVLGLVRKCMPYTKSGVKFNYGSQCLVNMHHDGQNDRQTGTMSILVRGELARILVEFEVETRCGKWDRGSCTLYLSSDITKKWEYYCETADNGSLKVTPMVLMRERRDLLLGVRAVLDRLGNNPGAIGRRLMKLDRAPDIEGLKAHLSRIFALTVYFSRVATQTPGLYYFEIYAVRLGDSELYIQETCLPEPIQDFAELHLGPLNVPPRPARGSTTI